MPCFDMAHFKARVRLTLLVAGQDPKRNVLSNTEVELSGDAADFSPELLGESGAAFVGQLLRRAADQQQEQQQQRQQRQQEQQQEEEERQHQYHHHKRHHHHHHKHSPCVCGSSSSSGSSSASSSASTDGRPPFPSSWHLTRFYQTPLMALYALGFWVGRFRSLQLQENAVGAVEPVRVTVYLPPHRPLEEGRFALECARRSFDFFFALFQPQEAGEGREGWEEGNNFYPLPKLDIICLPQMHGVGMEGWGSISILEEYLLVTPSTEFVRRRRIARLLAHEIVHQWFGNLVTPFSFDELWLKESTARFFEYVALAALQPPGWHVWSNFVSEIMLSAMLADANPLTSHPVLQHHHGMLRAIVDSFDVIVYGKGAALLRMLSGWVGMDVFVRGMRRLMTKLQYANMTEGEFYAVLEEEVVEEEEKDGGKGREEGRGGGGGSVPRPRVSDLMAPWLARVGYPALHVRVESSPLDSQHLLRLCFSQQPFSLLPGRMDVVVGPNGNSKGRERQARLIPLRVRVGVAEGEGGREEGAEEKGGNVYTLFVGEKLEEEVVLEVSKTTSSSSSSSNGNSTTRWWAVINDQHTGYFTTVYDGPEAWQLVLHALEGERMQEVERTGLVCDLMLGVQAALRGGGGGGGGGGREEVKMLLERLAEIVRGLEGRRGESSAYWNGRMSLYDIELLRLSTGVEEMEREAGEEEEGGREGGRMFGSGYGRWKAGSLDKEDEEGEQEASVVGRLVRRGGREKQAVRSMEVSSEEEEGAGDASTAAAASAVARLPVEQRAMLLQRRMGELLLPIDGDCEWAQVEAQKEGKEPLIEYVNKLRTLRGKVWRLKSRLQLAMAHMPLQQQISRQGVSKARLAAKGMVHTRIV